MPLPLAYGFSTLATQQIHLGDFKKSGSLGLTPDQLDQLLGYDLDLPTFCFLGPRLQHMEVPRLWVKSEL